MSQDIRSFFNVLSKKNEDKRREKPKPASKKKPIIIDDSDDDAVLVTETPQKKQITTKHRTHILSSDSEDEAKPKKKAASPSKKGETSKLKPVNIDDVFKNAPVKQSKVEYVPKPEAKEGRKKVDKHRSAKKNKKNVELEVHKDKDFQATLIQLDEDDDDIFLNNMDMLDKTLEEAEKERSCKETETPKKDVKKRVRKNSGSKDTPSKRQKLEHVDSGIDPDQDRWEKKRQSAMLYQKYLHRGGPKHHGSKEIPKGKENCLKDITFLRTGVLDSLASDEFDNLVKEHGGRVVHAVSKKVNYVVVGDDAGPSKLQKAKHYNIPEISEDQLLDMILVKSGMKPKYCIKNDSEDLGLGSCESSPTKSIKNQLDVEKMLEVIETEPEKFHKTDIKKHTEKNGSRKARLTEAVNKIEDAGCSSKERSITLKEETVHEKTKKNEAKIPSTSMTWTEKYKPSNLKSVIGQQEPNSNMNKLKTWLENWYHNQKPEVKNKLPKPSPWNQFDGSYFKCALLSGPPGVGKTTIATLVSKKLGFDVIEFNASDTRNKKLLHEEISQMINMRSIAGFAEGDKNLNIKRVLLMDEVDGMAGNEDRGGIAELINFIKTSNFPIICMCNDRNHQKMRALVNHCFGLRFGKPSVPQIRGAMLSICFKEGLSIKPDALAELISGTGCDIRQTLNNLSMWSALEKDLSNELVHKESQKSQKDVVFGIWDVARKIFSHNDNKNMSLGDKSRLFFYDYSLCPLFVQENYLSCEPNCTSSNKEKEKLIRAARTADSLSMGDLIESQIRRTNNWSLLDSQSYFSAVFPSYYMTGALKGVNFPGWFGKNSKRNKVLRILSELYSHTRTSTSGDRISMRLDYAIPLRNAIVDPLKYEGVDGIQKSLNVMKSYSLLKEDLNNLVEICHGFNTKNTFNDVESKVKSAFTRAYNKNMPLTFATPVATKRKRTVASEETDLLGEDEEDIEDDVEDDTVETDAMIKVKSKKQSVRAGPSKAKDVKDKAKKGSSKPKGKGKNS